MAEDLLRQRKPCGHQHGGPEHSVKAQDVFADHMNRGRPATCFETTEIWLASIVEQCCEVAE